MVARLHSADPNHSEVAVHYRAYTVGPDGHFIEFLSIEAEDDLAAMNAARDCLQDRDVEVWQQAREVGRFERDRGN
jgi:hypothetical protein